MAVPGALSSCQGRISKALLWRRRLCPEPQSCGVALQQVLTLLVQIPGPRATPLPHGPFLLSLCACSCAHGELTALHLPVLQV